MTIDLSVFQAAFLEEAREHLATLERGLLALERNSSDEDTIHQVFRAAHSIKGAAGTLGFAGIAGFTHQLESVLDSVRECTFVLEKSDISTLLEATDQLRNLVDAVEDNRSIDSSSPKLAALVERIGSSSSPRGPQTPANETQMIGSRRLQLEIHPKRNFFAIGLDPILLFRDLEALGTLSDVTCDVTSIPRLSELEPTDCNISWKFRLETTAADQELQDVFLFVADDCEVRTTAIELAPSSPNSLELPAVARKGRPAAIESATLRVSSEKVDSLIDLVGELVIAQSVVLQLLGEQAVKRTPVMRDAIMSMKRNMQELQGRIMGIRMVPVATLFGRFSRIVRDTATLLNKSVTLEIEGQDTEIDKAVVERLADPITHLVRNALDHGLETDRERNVAGKLEPATIRLFAEHVAGGIVIEVSDNGRGLDATRIREKAEQQGLVRPGDSLTDEQVNALIFEPGFSTASEVSSLSGRGVGMDVVRSCVDALNGTITIGTKRGEGTTIRIRLPVTLAILDGLLLRVGLFTYVVPLLAVTEAFRPEPNAVCSVTGAGFVALLRDQALPLVDLGVQLHLADTPKNPCEALVVMVEADGRQVGLVVDALLGQSQVVVKSIETHYRRVDGVLGATILGDGQVAFIIDVAGLVRLAWSRSGATEAA